MDSVRELEHCVPAGVEVKRLAGRIVWLRHAEGDWLGPAEEALALFAEASDGARRLAERDVWPRRRR